MGAKLKLGEGSPLVGVLVIKQLPVSTSYQFSQLLVCFLCWREQASMDTRWWQQAASEAAAASRIP